MAMYVAVRIVPTGIVLPVWLKITVYSGAPLVPYLHPAVLVGHLAYGAAVGALLGVALSVLEG